MNIERFLKKENERIYLRKHNGAWKGFANVIKSTFEECQFKFKKRKFRFSGELVEGACFMGKEDDEIWIYEKMSLEKKEKVLIHEIIHVHLADEELEKLPKSSKGSEDLLENLIEEMVEIIWSNTYCRDLIRNFLKKGG